MIEHQIRTPSGIWRTLRYDFQKPRDIARYVARNPYTWPGAYPVFAITDDGAALCKDCCRTEYRRIAESAPLDGFHVIERLCNWENASLYCDHCGARIESAYAEDTKEQ